MTLAELHTVLTGISGFSDKVAYYAFPEGQAPALPFICYLESGTNNTAADGIVYHSSKDIVIELYTEKKDTATEALVESALATNGIFWMKTEGYLSDERCWMITYTIEV